MFIGDLDDFDADLDLRDLEDIWQSCRSPTSLDMLLRISAGVIQNMSALERFDFVRTIIGDKDSAVLFMRKIEICAVSGFACGLTTLDRFCQTHGKTVLTNVACALGEHVARSDVNLWTQIGVTAIKNGTDPVTTAVHDRPLLCTLLSRTWSPYSVRLSIEHITTALELWIDTLKEANVDIKAYCLRTSEALQLPFFVNFGRTRATTARLVAIEYDDQTQKCILCVRAETKIPLKHLHHLPGSFVNRSLVPTTICWDPDKEEEEEGFWLGESFPLIGETMSLQKFVQTFADSYHGLSDFTQDDNGILMRTLDKSCRSRHSRKRASSQPAPLRRRRHDYETQHWSRLHVWMPPLHFCMDKSTWVFNNHEAVRDCLKCNDPPGNWVIHGCRSFLDDVYACQIGFEQFLSAKGKLHDFTQQCPQNCAKVNLNTLAVPLSLPPWHPGFFAPNLWYYAT